jgi:acyl-CoA synthetase (AMP-forming)/AMP-acid ligase II
MRIPSILDHRTFVGIAAANSPSYIQTVFACFNAGQIVVPLTDNSIELPSIIKLQDVLQPSSSSGWLQHPLPDRPPDEIAQITFTSGTEGSPKGVAIPHCALVDTVERLNRVMRVDDTIREYVGVPVFYSFGFARCRAVCKAGGKAYIPNEGFSLIEFAALLRSGSINALSAVPTLLRLVLRNSAVFQDCNDRLRWIEIGSQYMASSEKAALCALFPNARIVMHYGMTEASRTTLQVISETPDDTLGSVGCTHGNAEVKIASDGRIQIRGPHVAACYLIGDKAERLTDEGGWFQSNDLGEIRDGQLWFKGRADDIINVSGIKIASELIEQKLHSKVSDPTCLAVIGISDPLRGEKVLVAVDQAAQMDLGHLEKTAKSILTEIHPTLNGALIVKKVPSIPRTATNKVRRKSLRLAVTDSVGAATKAEIETETPSASTTPNSQMDRVISLFQQQFPRAEIGPDSTFESLGGTSLDYVEMTIGLERILDHDPGDWHRFTLEELCKECDATFWKLRFDQMAARAICAILVVFAHVIGDTPLNGLKVPQDSSLRIFNEFSNYFKMPLFAFISGWSFALLNTAFMRPKDFMSSTLKTLVIPASLTMAVFAGLTSQIGPRDRYIHLELEQVFLYPYEHFWFIQTLIFLVFLVYVGMRLPGQGPKFFLISLVVFPIAAPSLFATSLFSINGILVLGPYYALGILMSNRIDQRIAHPVTTLWAVGGLSVIAIVGAVYIYRETGGVLLMPHIVGFLIGLPLLFLCMIAAAYIPWVKRIAPYTFFIYLWHVFATSLTRRVLFRFGLDDITINVLAGTIAGVALPIFACIILKRLNLFAFLSGRW